MRERQNDKRAKQMGTSNFSLVLLQPILQNLRDVAADDEAKAWRCLDMLARYAEDGTEPENADLVTRVIFNSGKPYIDHCKQSYMNKAQANQENGRKGGRPRKASTDGEPRTGNLLTEEEENAIFQRLESDNGFFRQWNTENPLNIGCGIIHDDDFKCFKFECMAKAKLHKDEQDIKAHFFDWLRIQCNTRKGYRKMR